MRADEERQKQDYLGEQILSQGYDQNVFAEFLNRREPQKGLDVNQYTWDELCAYVDEFKNEQVSVYNNQMGVPNTGADQIGGAEQYDQ